MKQFNPIFGTFGNQIELTLLARRREAACRQLSAADRSAIVTAHGAQKRVLSNHIGQVESQARQWKPFIHVLPVG